MAESDSEVDLERGTTRSSSSTSDNLKTTRSLPSMVVTSSVSNCDYMNIELESAAIEDDVDKFNAVLDRLSEKQELAMLSIFETVSPFHNTLLHVASLHGSLRIVEQIASRSPSTLKKTNLRGETALHTAAKAGKSEIVSSLINLQEEYASSDDRDKNLFKMGNVDGNTALHEALIYGHESVAIDLINADPDVSFCVNEEGKSPLYLAAEAGYFDCVKAMMESEAYNRYTWPCQNSTAKDDQISPSPVEVVDDQKDLKKNDEATKQDGVLQVKSPIHAAVLHACNKKNSEVEYQGLKANITRRKRRKTEQIEVLLKYMLDKEPKFIDFRDEEGRSVLHFAAYFGYLEGVKYLLKKDPRVAFQRDNDGFFPVHFAAVEDDVGVIKVLRPYCLHLAEMLSHNYHNILHSAANFGASIVVSYVLKTKGLDTLINQKDKDGNTPLHWAAIGRDPLSVILLTRDKRVDEKSLNNEGWTALDACKYLNDHRNFQLLIAMILKKSGVKPSPIGKPIDKKTNSFNKADQIKDISNALIVVSTLVATVTFAAGFTVPGGYNEQGTATMLKQATFHAFLVCDTVAMYSSIIAALILTWAQGQERLVSFAYQLAFPSLSLALIMMSLAYIFGICLVVSKLSWLAKLILGLGMCFQSILALAFLLLFFSLIAEWGLLLTLKLYNWLASLIEEVTKSGW